jgi:hypothetical protein
LARPAVAPAAVRNVLVHQADPFMRGHPMKPIRLALILCVVMTCASAVRAQTVATGRVMREKLGHSQKILEGILTADFGLLGRETEALGRATESPAWSALKGPEYSRQSEAFLKALGDLKAAVDARDLDAAMGHYTELTMTCYRCHRYITDNRRAAR